MPRLFLLIKKTSCNTSTLFDIYNNELKANVSFFLQYICKKVVLKAGTKSQYLCNLIIEIILAMIIYSLVYKPWLNIAASDVTSLS